jgi:hypothetical protein
MARSTLHHVLHRIADNNTTSSDSVRRHFSGRSQWPRDLRHEMYSPDRTLESWVRNPLKAWMFACVYSMFVCRSPRSRRPCDGVTTNLRSPTDCLRLRI